MAERNEPLIGAQTSVLGAMLIDERCVPVVLDLVKSEYFTVSQYRRIFDAIRELTGLGRPVDPITVLDRVGKEYADLLMGLMDITPTSANVECYCGILKKEARMQLLRNAASEMLAAACEDDFRTVLDKINAVMVDRPDFRVVNMSDALTDFYHRHDPSVKPDYLPWRFQNLNDALRTIRGDLGIIGGYPSDGKTTLALTTAAEQAKTKKVGFFSFETDASKLVDAMVATAAQIGLPKIQLNALGDHDWDTLAAISGDFCGRNLDLIEAAGMTVSDIRQYSMSKHYDVIYIDYLQLIESSDKSQWGNQEYARVTANSRALKQFGRQGGPTIIALSQMSRPQAGKNGLLPPPSMANLRSSGQIEQDADFILLLFREDQKRVDCDRIITVAKNKTGVAGNSFYLAFKGETQTFSPSRRDYKPPKPKKEEPVQQEFPLLNTPDPDIPF